MSREERISIGEKCPKNSNAISRSKSVEIWHLWSHQNFNENKFLGKILEVQTGYSEVSCKLEQSKAGRKKLEEEAKSK